MKRLFFSLIILMLFPVFLNSSTLNIELSKGWNLKGSFLSEIPANNFQNITTIWKWTGNSWKIYSPDSNILSLIQSYNIPVLSKIYAGEGFWINTGSNLSISFSGNTPDNASLNIVSGWSLLSLKTSESASITTFKKDFISTIWKWSDNSWRIYSPVKSIMDIIKTYQIKTISSIAPGEGFWVNAKSNGEIYFESDNDKYQSFALSTSINELTAQYDNISIADPVIISFTKPLKYDNTSMKSFQLISITDQTTKEPVKGKFLLSNNKTSIIFFPDTFFKPDTDYKVFIAKEITSSSGETVPADYIFNVHTSSYKNIFDIITDNTTIIAGKSIDFSYKFHGKISTISSQIWNKSPFTIDKNIIESTTATYSFNSEGVSEIKLEITDNFGRKFSQKIKIYVYPNLQNFFSSTISEPSSYTTLKDEIWDNSPSLYQALNNFKNSVISIYKITPPENLLNKGILPNPNIIAVEMKKDDVSTFKQEYLNNLIKNNKLIGFAIYKGFPAILSYREINKKLYLDVMFDTGNVEFNTYYNENKIDFHNAGISDTPVIFRFSIITSDKSVSALKETFGQPINSYSDLKFIDFKKGDILVKSFVTSSSVKTSGFWSTVTSYAKDTYDTASDAVDDTVDYLENVINKITQYISQAVIYMLNNIKEFYNKINQLNFFTKLNGVKNDFTTVKNKLVNNLNKFTSNTSNIITSATDPDKLLDKLKDLLANDTDSVKNLFELLMKKLESGSFSGVADILLDKLQDDISSTETSLQNAISTYISTDKNAYIEFILSASGTLKAKMKYNDTTANLTINTIDSILQVTDWTEAVNFPLDNLKTFITNIKNTLDNLPEAVIGAYYDPAFFPVESNFHFDFNINTANENNLFKFVVSLKPVSPSVLIKFSNPSDFDDYLKFYFSPYSMKVVEPEDNESLNSIFSSVVNTMFSNISESKPYPNGKIRLHIDNLFNALNVDISGELMPMPQISVGGKLEIGLSEHALIGGGGKISPQLYLSFPLNIAQTSLSTILSTTFNSLMNSFSSITSFNDLNANTFCNTASNLSTDLYDNITENILSNINIGFGVQSSGEIGVGAGGTGAGASADAELAVGVDISTALSTFTSLLGYSGDNSCLFSYTEFKKYFSGNPVAGLKTLPLILLTPISNISLDTNAFWEDFAQNFSLSFGGGVSADVEGNFGAGVEASAGTNFSFSVNGEYILNTIYYFVQNPDDPESTIRKYDHPSIYPEISFGVSYGGELSGGLSLPLGIKSSFAVSLDSINGVITLPSNPFLNTNSDNSKSFKIYPLVKISTNSTTKDATFNSTIILENNTSISEYKWYVNSITTDNSSFSEKVGNVTTVNSSQLHVNFKSKGTFPVTLYVKDSKGREMSYVLNYNVPNTPPKTPSININNNSTLHNGDTIYFSSTDADNDNITYIVTIADDSNFTTNVKTFKTGSAFTLSGIPVGSHYLKAKAYDNESYSEWSDTINFNIANSKPVVSVENIQDYDYNNDQICDGFTVYYYVYDADNDTLNIKIGIFNQYKDLIGWEDPNPISKFTKFSIRTGDLQDDFQDEDISENEKYYIQIKVSDGKDTTYTSLYPFILCAGVNVELLSPDNLTNYKIGDNVSFEISTDLSEDELLSQDYQAKIKVATDQNFNNIIFSTESSYDEVSGFSGFNKWTITNTGKYYIIAELYEIPDNQGAQPVFKGKSNVLTLEVSDNQTLLSDDFNTIDNWQKKIPSTGTYAIESYNNAFHYKRSVFNQGDFTGIEKTNLGFDIFQCSEAYVEFDVKLIGYGLKSSGSWTYYNGGYGEFPADIIIHFTDTNGQNFVWNHGFLDVDDKYKRTNYTKIPLNTWYHYKSPDLTKEKTTETNSQNASKYSGTIKTINSIFLGGNGWSFEGYFDNFKLICK